MRLLLTRAEPEAQASAERLRQLGHGLLIAPMLDITALPPPAEIPDPAAIAFTSANAVRAIATWPKARAWKAAQIFAVGDATADAARAAGFTKVVSAKGGSAELAALIATTLSADAGPVLCPAAETPAGDLAGALRAAGLVVHQVTAYRATPATELPTPTRDAIVNRAIDAILFYSERGAAAFVDLVTGDDLAGSLAGVRLLALSVQVAGPLRVLAAARLNVADQPTEASLFALLAAND